MQREFSLYNIETREIGPTGIVWGNKEDIPEGWAVYYGAEVDRDAHIMGPDDTPIPRSTPRPLDETEFGAAVNRERQRRIEAGKVIAGVKVTGSDKDILNLTNLALGAQLRMAMGDDTLTVFRDGDNVDHELSPAQVIGLWQAASTHVSALYAASWMLKEIDPQPADPTDDAHWPA